MYPPRFIALLSKNYKQWLKWPPDWYARTVMFFVRFLSAKDNTMMEEEFEPKMCHTLSFIMYKTSTNVEELQTWPHLKWTYLIRSSTDVENWLTIKYRQKYQNRPYKWVKKICILLMLRTKLSTCIDKP